MSVRVTAVGELLCDLLPGQTRPGGAPANFAFHVQQLGGRARLISRVGNDAHGRLLLAYLQQHGLDTADIQFDRQAPTGTAEVVLNPEGVPRFAITGNVAWDQIRTRPWDLLRPDPADAIYFGTLAQRSPRSREAIRTLVDTTPAHALRIFDPNLRTPNPDPEIIEWSIGAANVIKLSQEELALLAPMLGVTGDEADCLAHLGRTHRLKAVALTRGARGSLLWTPDETAECAPIPTRVRDTVGAGDAYVAALAMGLLHQWPASEIVQRAGEIAAFVCSQPGAMPRLPRALRDPFYKTPCFLN